MPVCTGGSQPKPATPALVALFGVGLSNLMERYFPRSSFAELVSFIAGQTLSSITLCAGDPPAMPVWDATTDFQFPAVPPFLTDAGVQKLITMVQIAAWYTFCDCLTMPTPPPPPAPVYPPGAPVLNPPGIPPGQTGPCWQQTATLANATPTLQGQFNNVTLIFLPNINTVTVNSGIVTPTTTPAQTIPTGAVSITYSTSWSGLGAGDVLSVTLHPCDSTGAILANHIILDQAVSSGSTPATTFVLPAATQSWFLEYEATDSLGHPVGGFSFSMSVEVDCASLNQPQQPCCPPDQTLQGMLQLILNDVNELLTRAALPRLPLYQPAATHVGLSGAGSVIIQTNAVAFRVDVTSPIPNWPNNPGDPNYYFSMGFVTSFALQTPIKGWRLVYTGQTFPLAAQCDQVGYTLPPGITVTITELAEAPGA